MTPVRTDPRIPGRPSETAVGFALFYDSTKDLTLRGMCHLAGNREVAEEATQEAYARVLYEWPTRQLFDLDANRSYTVAIARNLVMDWFRSQKPLTPLEERHDRPADVPDPACSAEAEVVLAEVYAEIERQPHVRRDVAYLHFLDGCSYQEIAAKLGIAESTVRNHVHRLRRVLEPHLLRFRTSQEGR